MWRELARTFPHATRIDPQAYAPELDAVDLALRQAEAWEPTPADEKTLAIIETGDGPPVELVARGAPQPPVRGDDPARVAAAVLQRLAWNEVAAWGDIKADAPPGGYGSRRFHTLYAMAARLLRRRLRPTPAVAADLIALAVSPPPEATRVNGRDDFLYPVLKVLERQFVPPVPPPMPAALADLSERVRHIRGETLASQCRFRRRASTLHEDKTLERIRRLLG